MSKTIMYSLVVPVFRGEQTLKVLTAEVRNVFQRMDASYEIIFVDDSGTEINWPIICQLKEAYPLEVRGIQLSKNYGQHPATFCGLLHSQGDFIITMDEDLQHSPLEIPRLVAHQQSWDYDLVYGTYPNDQQTWSRRISSDFFRKVLTYIFPGLSAQYSSFRLLKSELLDSFRYQSFVPDFLDVYWVKKAKRVGSIHIDHQASQAGKSSYSWPKLGWHAFRILFTIAKISLPHYYKSRQLGSSRPSPGLYIKEIV